MHLEVSLNQLAAAVPTMERSASPGHDMAGSIVIDKGPSGIFVAAYLLTGSAMRAERVMLESIQHLDVGAYRSGRLSWKALDHAMLQEDTASERAPEEPPIIPLPVELLRVLRLSTSLRQCFVLRVLMAMPPQYCAGLVRMDVEQVEANCCLAAWELAKMAGGIHAARFPNIGRPSGELTPGGPRRL